MNKNSYIFHYYELFDKKSELSYGVLEKIQGFEMTKMLATRKYIIKI